MPQFRFRTAVAFLIQYNEKKRHWHEGYRMVTFNLQSVRKYLAFALIARRLECECSLLVLANFLHARISAVTLHSLGAFNFFSWCVHNVRLCPKEAMLPQQSTSFFHGCVYKAGSWELGSDRIILPALLKRSYWHLSHPPLAPTRDNFIRGYK